MRDGSFRQRRAGCGGGFGRNGLVARHGKQSRTHQDDRKPQSCTNGVMEPVIEDSRHRHLSPLRWRSILPAPRDAKVRVARQSQQAKHHNQLLEYAHGSQAATRRICMSSAITAGRRDRKRCAAAGLFAEVVDADISGGLGVDRPPPIGLAVPGECLAAMPPGG
jgi:hypothetical protein